MELFKLLGTIAVDNTKAKTAIDETTDKAEEGSNKTSEAFSKIGTVAGTIAKGIFAVGATVGGAFIAAVESTREYRKEMGLLEAAFLTAGHSSESAKQTYSELNAVLGDSGQAVEASQHLAKLVKNEKDLQTWTDICTGVYATFGASLPIEGLTEAANETAKTGILTGGLTDALNWAGISEESFQKKLDACSNEQERQKLIMDTLNKTYKDAATQYQETNKDVIESEKAQQRLTDAFAEVGAVGEPIMTAVKNAIAGMVEKAVPVIESLIEKFRDMVKWVKDNQETIDIWVGVIIGATVSVGTFLLILNWGSIMAAASSAIKGVTLAVKALNLAMKANIIGLIVSLIVGLVAAFIYLWNECDAFRNFWIKLWNVIKDAASKAWTAIKKAFSSIGTWFKDKFEAVQKSGKDAMDKVKKWFSDAWNGIKKTWSAVKSFFSGIWTGIKNVFSSVNTWFRSKFQSAWTSIKNVFSGWGSFFGGLWDKIKSKFSSIGTSIGKTMGNAVKSGLNKVLSTVESTINKGIGLINSAIKLANKLPGINVGTVSKLSLPRLAEGGVLKKGQIGLLEGSGAEAVVPLEKNTGWLDKIAERLNKSQPDWIETKLNAIINILNKLCDCKIILDSGALVGELTPAINAHMGDIFIHQSERNNTR